MLHLRPSRPVAGLPATATLSGGEGALRLDGLRMAGPGTLSIAVEDSEGRLLALSNPMVTADDPPFRHYWSDLHGQSEETVGTNTARDYFAFARDKGLVDIAGHQGNDFQITDSFWRELNALTAEFDAPGRFLAVPGYEWSGNTSVGGDHNVWYRTEGQPIFRSHRALVGADADPATDCLDARALFDRLAGLDALVVAHVGGRYADVRYAHDARLEPSVEVHSAWGTFEWIVRDALEAGYRVGIVGGSDDHKGRPGASYPGASKFGAFGGLTCHLLPALTRDALFAAFRRRRHYATTGCRAHVALHLDGFGAGLREDPNGAEPVERAEIGDILAVSGDSATMHLRVLGHCGIERVEIRDGLDSLAVVRPMEAARQSGRRLRVRCEGAEYKGRGRLVRWDVRLALSGCRIEAVQPINFWNPDQLPRAEPQAVTWTNVTTGGFHAVDLSLSGFEDGALRFRSNVTDFDVALGALGADDHVVDCGGLAKRVRLTRLPVAQLPSEVEHRFEVALPQGVERRLYVRVDFEDGHAAWTSPIYVRRRETPAQGTCRRP